jgi:hypothetical protein
MTKLIAILMFLSPLQALACPQQNENLFVPEFNGQENFSVGHIDTLVPSVEIDHIDYSILEVDVNGAVLCVNTCKSPVRIGNRPLSDGDHVRVVVREIFSRQDFTFERFNNVKDQGSFCRPIWAR